MPLYFIEVTTIIFDEDTEEARFALPNEINVELDGPFPKTLTIYPTNTANVSWQGDGSVLFTSIRGFLTTIAPIEPGDYTVKSILRADTRIWHSKWITLLSDGRVIVTNEDAGTSPVSSLRIAIR